MLLKTGEPEKQGALVRQLQEQHYIQYMQQLQAAHRGEQLIKNDTIETDSNKETKKNEVSLKSFTRYFITYLPKHFQIENEDLNDSNDTEPQSLEEMLIPASMWTRSDIDAFKQAVSQAEGDGVVRVGHGETVTVRVPTHQEGSRLFWEFATDHYDIGKLVDQNESCKFMSNIVEGFGVYFEYGTPNSDQVSVHVSESDDEDLEDEVYDEETIHTADLEAGSVSANGVSKPLLTEIVPVFRRDCQNEVYAGSHQYPGQGVYLLKFDNSYSLWRSKTLYYRVYYTQ